MGRKTELTGQKFGRLTVLKDSKKRKSGQVVWLCKCECGKSYEVCSRYLTDAEVKSCGCLRKPDIIGKKYNRLTVLERTAEQAKGGNYLYKCKCDCGNITYLPSNHITSGYIKSCGCYAKELSSERGKEQIKTALEKGKEYYIDNTNVLSLSRKKLNKNNTSGHTGVHFCNKSGRWKANIYFKGTHYTLGTYMEKADAIEVRKKAEKNMHGAFLEWYAENYPEKWEKIQIKRESK